MVIFGQRLDLVILQVFTNIDEAMKGVWKKFGRFMKCRFGQKCIYSWRQGYLPAHRVVLIYAWTNHQWFLTHSLLTAEKNNSSPILHSWYWRGWPKYFSLHVLERVCSAALEPGWLCGDVSNKELATQGWFLCYREPLSSQCNYMHE